VGERPAGVVVGMFLRIVGRPELAVEQRVGNAGVGLIHANDDGDRREGSGWACRPAWPRDGGGGGFSELLDFNMLALEHLEQFTWRLARLDRRG